MFDVEDLESFQEAASGLELAFQAHTSIFRMPTEPRLLGELRVSEMGGCFDWSLPVWESESSQKINLLFQSLWGFFLATGYENWAPQRRESQSFGGSFFHQDLDLKSVFFYNREVYYYPKSRLYDYSFRLFFLKGLMEPFWGKVEAGCGLGAGWFLSSVPLVDDFYLNRVMWSLKDQTLWSQVVLKWHYAFSQARLGAEFSYVLSFFQNLILFQDDFVEASRGEDRTLDQLRLALSYHFLL